MHPAVVADAGGLLVLAGLLEGIPVDVDEILVLDATALIVAEYLAVRHDGSPERARSELALATRIAREWFPVRALAIEVALSASSTSDIDALASLALADSLKVPLLTKNRELTSSTVQVLHC